MTNDELVAAIASLAAAISRGTKMVRYGEKVVEYQSIGDMLDALAAMRRELRNQDDVISGTPRYQLANFSDKP